jgi:dTMP kinase
LKQTALSSQVNVNLDSVMKQKIPGGLLVVVEGVDGSGKSSVLKHLVAHCATLPVEVVQSREPTDGPFGKRLRESALSGRFSMEEELDLFIADRLQHVAEVIAPALDRGALILLDRYYFSTAAYQGARGADPAAVLALNEAFAPQPDLVLLLDCPPVQTLERIKARGGGVDAFEKLEELEAVQRIFLSINRPFLRRIDASLCEETVGNQCVTLLEEAVQQKLTSL